MFSLYTRYRWILLPLLCWQHLNVYLFPLIFLQHPHCASLNVCIISAWTAAHHLKLNLSKPELLFIPEKDCLHMDLSVTVEDVTVLPSLTVRNLGVIVIDRLSCTLNITAVARFALYNICRIWSKCWSSPAWTTLTPSWMDSHCSVSRMVQHSLFSMYPNFPMWPPAWPPLDSYCSPHLIQDYGTGFQGHQWNCTHLLSDHTPQNEHFAPLHQLASWYPHCWKQGKDTQCSHNSSLFWHSVLEQTPDQCQDSRVTCSEFTSTPHSMTPLF